jgi:TetR/AcrR family transcriptional regulator
MASTRRIGKETSKTRLVLLDATEKLMLEEGYAAVSSRRVAAVAGVKPALIHYYFPTMDDLFVALFQRGAERNMARLARAAEGPRPLRALWDLSREQRGAVLLTEFTALSRHRPAVRAELAAYGRRFRRLQRQAMRHVLEANGIGDSVVSAEAVAVLLTGVSTTVALEREVGLTTGHKQALALVQDLLERYEPEDGGLEFGG